MGLTVAVSFTLFTAVCLNTQLDVAIDGADEVDAGLTLIKGGG